MIKKLEIRVPQNAPLSWTSKVIPEARTFSFAPGLNVLWGRNASGKTTVLRTLATLLHCRQGGTPVVTETSVQDLYDKVKPADLMEGVALHHDGQGVRYVDTAQAVGLAGTTFDWDFGMEGIQNIMFKGSAGQTTEFRLNGALGAIIKGEVPEVTWKCSDSAKHEPWKTRLDVVKHFLRGKGKKGPPTLLFDEPERSLDWDLTPRLWRLLRAYSTRFQFIVASHSLFALQIPEANYIELSPGYMTSSEVVQKVLATWPQETPKPLK